MRSHARTKQIFLLVSACVMFTHFTIVYLFVRENFLTDSEEVPVSWYIPDQRSPLEDDINPFWGADVPFSFDHNLTHVLRVLKSHSSERSSNKSFKPADNGQQGSRPQGRVQHQYRDLYDNYGGYEYEDFGCKNMQQEPPEDFDEPLAWQEVVPRRVFVFSAYLEPVKGSLGKIVIIGMGDSNVLMDERFYCQVWYRSGKSKFAVVKAVLERVEEHRDRTTVVNFWLCEADISNDPYVVYVVHRTPCTDDPRNILLIRNIDESQARTRPYNNFTVCTSPLVNNYNTNAFVENAEMNLLLGASVLVYYKHSTSEMINNYLISYKNEDLANVIPWTLPVKVSNSRFGRTGRFIAQLAALNDCFYRYRYTARYILFTDLDELIISKKYPTWPHLFQKIHNKSSPVSVFRFHRVIFPLNAPDDETVTTDSLSKTLGLVTQLKTKKDTAAPSWQRGSPSKYAVVPNDIDMVGVNYPLVMRGSSKDVDPSDAVVHHYGTWEVENAGANLTDDRILHLYQKALTKKVVKRHKIVKGRVI